MDSLYATGFDGRPSLATDSTVHGIDAIVRRSPGDGSLPVTPEHFGMVTDDSSKSLVTPYVRSGSIVLDAQKKYAVYPLSFRE
jgi:hypothetical protein